MKFKSLFFAALAAVISFASCEEMGNGQDLGSPALTVNATELSFEEAGGDQSVVLNSTRDWKVTSSAAWVTVNPASGKASADDQTVVVSATLNEDGNRNATLTFTNGMVTKTVKVSQVGTGVTPGIPSEGDGTEASPYSASQALAITKEMEKDVVGTNTVYVTGKVAQIKDAYSDQYGNVSFYITDDGAAADKNDMFLVYRCKYFGNEKFSSADQLKVGDEVVVVGNLINYYGNTPELKNSYVIKINGETSGSTVTPPAGDDNTGDDNTGDDNTGDGGNVTPVEGNSDDFVTLTSSRYYEASLKTTNGWEVNNCQVHVYGTGNTNDTFAYVPEGNKAVCMNGKTSAAGKITSPVIAGGCEALSFNYCYPFSEANGVSFKVEILQNDAVVKSFDVVNKTAAKYDVCSHTEQIGVTGNFTIRFTNNTPSNNSSSNKDRYSIWNVTWTSKAE